MVYATQLCVCVCVIFGVILLENVTFALNQNRNSAISNIFIQNGTSISLDFTQATAVAPAAITNAVCIADVVIVHCHLLQSCHILSLVLFFECLV